MNKAIGNLKLNRPHLKSETAGGVSLQNIYSVKEQLLGELVELQQQMELLEQKSDSVDFSMMQTYKEMMHSREILFNELG
jgi:hypothetical protein